MDLKNIERFVEDNLKVKKIWYHKIPYIGDKIYKRQSNKKYQLNKFKLFDLINETVGKEVLSGEDNTFLDSFINIDTAGECFLERK